MDCARVRIRGGVALTRTFQPVVLPPSGRCATRRVARGLCRNDKCPGRPPAQRQPAEFADGARPAPIPATFFGHQWGEGGEQREEKEEPLGAEPEASAAPGAAEPAAAHPVASDPGPEPATPDAATPATPSDESTAGGTLTTLDVIDVGGHSRVASLTPLVEPGSPPSVVVPLPSGGVNVEAVTLG